MIRLSLLILLTWVASAQDAAPGPPTPIADTNADVTVEPARPATPIRKVGPPNVRIAQLAEQTNIYQRNYADAVPTLLREINTISTVKVDTDPALIRNFEDPEFFNYPFVYINYADRQDWTFTPLEQHNLKLYLERGGFLFIDAGVNASFLRSDRRQGQHHSFAEWEASPELQEAFAGVFPGKAFQPLGRDHEIFASFYKGLPDPSDLPDTVREYVVNEKWPQGTYSAVGLNVKGRLAVLTMPIIAMGWGRNSLGNWSTTIRFRVLESAEGLSDYLKTAAYSGDRYETRREDGDKDTIYCQAGALPAWAQEPTGRWRVFRYYGSREISDYAHLFYTQLGVNILTYALTN
jgi:hypothetical protein